MAEAVALLLNPSDTSKGYVVWNHGELVPFGGQPPTDAEIRYTDRVRGAQILDWNAPSGATWSTDGEIKPFGGALWSEGPTHAAFPIVRAVHMNPSGSNQGYKMLADASYVKWGVGTPNLSYVPATDGADLVVDWAYEWGTGRSLILRRSGAMAASTGITGSTVDQKPGRNVYRALVIREWDATPGFWVVDYAGTVFKGNGAEVITGGLKWYGRDAVRDIAVISDGLGGDPLELAVLTYWGGIDRYVVSSPPTVTIVAPSTPITTTSRPSFRWNYTDPNGDAQVAYDFRLFTAAQHAIGGFDPATSPNSGVYYGTDRSVFEIQVDDDLPNGSYVGRVRVRDSAGDLSAWSAAYAVTVNVTPPATPTVTATPAGKWTATVAVASSLVGGTVELEYTDDAPTVAARTWTRLRASGAAGTAGTLYLVDRESPLNRRRWYRARNRNAAGTIASVWSAETSATVPEDVAWVLSDPTVAVDAIAVDVIPDLSWSEPIPSGVNRPPMLREAIVVRGAGRQSAEATVTLRTDNQADHDVLRGLLDGRRPLLFRSPYGQHWYCEATGELATTMLDGIAPLESETTVMRHVHQSTVTFTETARP